MSACSVGEGESCRRRPGASSRGPDCSLYTFPLIPIPWLLAPVEPFGTRRDRASPRFSHGGAHVLDGPAAVQTPSWAGGRAGEQGVPTGAPSAAALEARAPLLSIDARPVPTHPGAQLHSPGPLPSLKRRPPLRALSPGLLHRVWNGGGQSLGGHPLAAGPLAGAGGCLD